MRVGRSAKRKVGYTRNSFSRGVGVLYTSRFENQKSYKRSRILFGGSIFGLISEPHC